MNGVIHHYASFSISNPIVILTSYQIIKAHHSEDSSRLKEKCQSQIPMKPSSNHCLFSFTVFFQGNTGSSFSRDVQEAVTNNLPRVSAASINLGSHIHSRSSGFIKTCISITNHGNFIQPSSFTNLARYTLHQAVNTASRIQYRPAVSLQESISQALTYTSPL
ncbi:hypothetical protein O181_091151 [Austropuccinia psidii MF-1]|uniref:Uncharacterized protein n=1 Tax=Austropuccinia psidii MF-1 TaxID=1389203 RepID=A0A9Q3P9D0_9BASI|nr:hypothetical protein [Austropuccinia psidii MF-1]